MKSLVRNVFSTAAVVACLALVLSRPAGADDKDHDKDQPEVKKHAVVVHADANINIAEAVKKALAAKVKGLSEDERKKIELKLESLKSHPNMAIKVESLKDAMKSKKDGQPVQIFVIKADGKDGEKTEVKVDAHALFIESDGKGQVFHLHKSGDDVSAQDLDKLKNTLIKKAHGAAAIKHIKAIRIAKDQAKLASENVKKAHEQVAKAKKLVEAKAVRIAEVHEALADGKKAIAIAVAIDDDDVSVKHGVKEIKVKIEDGKIFINGKPAGEVKMDGKVKTDGEKTIRVQVKADAEDGEKKTMRRRIVLMGEKGTVEEIHGDIDIDVKGVVAGEFHKAHPHAIVVRKQLKAKDGDKAKPEIHVRAIRVDEKSAPAHKIMAGHAQMHSDKTHTDVTKQLKGIENELKKIRQLLEKMQDND